jgi:hypothetical protein
MGRKGLEMRGYRVVISGVVAMVALTSMALGAPVHPSAAHVPAVAGDGDGGGQTAPGDDFLTSRLLTGNRTPSADAFRVVGQEAQALSVQSASADPTDANAQWTFQGPTNIDNNGAPHTDGGGRIPDLAVDPKHAGTVYVATAGGGLWKTTDAGAHFASAWPITSTQAMGAVAVGSDGTVWAGTGETNPGGGSITFFGDGLYRSSDGGANWSRTTLIGSGEANTIARIAIDPTNPNHVWVAVSGNLFIAGGNRGVYVTSDGGTTWKQSLAPPNGTTGADDIQVDPKDPKTVYAAMWDHVRTPDHRTYTGIGSGVWKTTDGGSTWTELTSPTAVITNHLLADNPNNGRIGIGLDPENDQNVYIDYANDPTGKFLAFFVSNDGGTTFTPPPAAQAELAPSQLVYGWWFGRVWVDPKNSSNIWLAGLNLYYSNDGGMTWTSDNTVHADQHAMAWDPNVPNQVYLGDDGGFYTSTKNGQPDASGASTFTPAAFQPWTQFDGLDVSEQTPSRIIGGLQDNGSQRSWATSGGGAGQAGWNSTYGGDGQQNLVNPKNQQIVYSCLQYGNCAVSSDGGNTMTEFDTGGTGATTTGTVSGRHAYFTPMAFDPTNPSTVYYAGDVVNVSNDDGNNWTPISPNLGGTNPGTETDPLYAGHYGAVTTLSVSKTDPNTVWAGTDVGMVWMTSNAKSSPAMPTWTQVTGLPTQWVSRVLIDPANVKVVYVTFTGYRAGDNHPYVERTNDGGSTWTNLTGNLPEATVNDVALVNNRLYAATDTGVYVSDPAADPVGGGAFAWRELGNNLPNIAATALRFIPGNSTLYVATFGRGVWSLAIAAAPVQAVPEVAMPLLLVPGGAAMLGMLAWRRRRRPRWSS